MAALRRHAAGIGAALMAAFAPLAAAAQEESPARESPARESVAPAWLPWWLDTATVYGGRFTDNKWTEIASFDEIGVRDAWMAGIGLTHEIVGNRYAALELEGVAVRWFGDQEHWEFDAILMARWRAFPWNDTLPTSVALGIGPSWATEVPAEEVAIDGDSARLLLYWNAELEVGLPDRPWSAVARLHHRSNAYGVFSDEGGSNVLTLGLRYRF